MVNATLLMINALPAITANAFNPIGPAIPNAINNPAIMKPPDFFTTKTKYGKRVENNGIKSVINESQKN